MTPTLIGVADDRSVEVRRMVKRPPKKSETLEVRLSYDAKQAFMEACGARGLSASEAVRAFVETFPEKRSRLALNTLSKELTMLFTKISTPLKISGAVAAAAVGSLALGVAPSAADPDKRAQFEKLDANGDESVSLGELYESAGYNADGTVSEEFYAEMLAVAVSSANASTPGLFNEDGLKKLVASHLEPALEQGSRTVRNIFKEFDADGDGGLSFQEYRDADSHNDWRDRDD